MRIKPVIVVLLCLLCTAVAYAQCPPQGSLNFPITLSGSQFGGSGSGTSFGNGFVTVNPANSTATVQLNTIGLGPNITSAGLYNNGTSFLPFYSSSTNNTNQNGTGTFQQNGSFTNTVSLTQAQLNALLANPGAFSFGVNTAEFPNGAISGTLMNANSFSGTFSGTNLVGTTGATNGGGAFTANITPNATGGGSTLTYSFMPTNIGTSFTGLSLNTGGTGTNGTQFVNLAPNGGTLTNGRFTGSAQLTDAQVQALMTNPSGFYLNATTSQFPNGAVRAQFGATQYETWFPVAGNVRGAFGANWVTDIRIYNDGAGVAPANVTMELFPAGQSANITSVGTMNALASSTVIVNPRSTSSVNNVTQTLSSSFSGLGGLRITSDQPIVAIERIYDANGNSSNNGNGNGNTAAISAQAIPGLTMCDALSRGIVAGLTSAVTNGSNLGVRTNIGMFNPNPVAVNVIMNMNSNLGTAIGGQQTMTLQPYQLVQMPLAGTPGNGFFNLTADVTDAALTFQSSAPIFAYASNTANTNSDTHVLYARPDMSTPAVAQADVVSIATVANQGEVQEGQVAVSRASSATVRQFAQQMITDHTAALAQLQSVSSAAGVTASTNNGTALALQAQTQQELTQLNGLSGTAFDRAYMQGQVTDHQKVLQMLDTMLLPSASATPSLVSFLQQMRGTVAQHLATAQSILSQLP
jgi:putative membrane protein